MDRRQLLQHLALGATASLPGITAAQSAYPNQAIRFVVPFTPGSTSDVIARAVTERLEKAFKQPCIVDNRPGAGGTLGASAVAAAPADGYTVLIHSAGHVANAALYPKLKYDTLADFTPVTMMASMPNVLVVAPGKGYTSVRDLVQKAKASPGQIMYGSAGNGSGSHIAAEKFRLAAGLPPAHVPYRGAPEALNDVMGGRIDWFMSPIAVASALIAGGKLIPLAVGTTKRAAQLPNVPTTVESGYDGSDYLFWIGMFVNSKTPPDIVARLHAETVVALQSEEVQLRFRRLGAEASAIPQKDFAALVTAEALATAALIKKADIKVE